MANRWFPVAALAATLFVCGCAHKNTTDPAPKPKSGLSVVRIQTGPGVEIRPILASPESGKSEVFRSIVAGVHPYAAINGTFFSPEMAPQGDVLVDGKLAVRGHYPNAIAMRKNGRVEFVRRQGKRFDWSGYKAALSAGPRLVHNGKILLDPVSDGFRKAALTIVASRSGVGLTQSGELLLAVQRRPVKLAEFAQTMLDLGAVEAINLDGGPACGLYHDGVFLEEPALRMTNVLCVFRRR